MTTISQNSFCTIKTAGPNIDAVNGSILLPVDGSLVSLPSSEIEIDGRKFDRKPEFHVTLVGKTAGALLVAAAGKKTSVFDEIKKLTEQMFWGVERTGNFALVHKLKTDSHIDARSVIEMVNIKAIDHFMGALSDISGVKLPTPPLHITLYTNGDPKGIAIASKEDLNTYLEKKLPSLTRTA